LAGALVTPAATWVIGRIARRALFAAIPIFTCFALLLGVWNGYASGFDSEYLRALTHHWANADALRHMRPSDATLACADARMKLTQDARDLCREGEAGASAAPE
jgi:hypothetical protein